MTNTSKQNTISAAKPTAVKARKAATSTGIIQEMSFKTFKVMQVTREYLEDLSKKDVVRVQRDHVKRAQKVTYLKGELHGNQLEFAAAYNTKTKEYVLIDGYTRCELLKNKMVTLPKDGVVSLTVHFVATESDLERLYDQYNNPTASKKAPDRLDEGLRLSGLTGVNALRSPLMSKGSRAAAIRKAAFNKETRPAVQATAKGIQFVDSLMLTKRNETVPQMASYLVIGQYASHLPEAEEVIRNINWNIVREGKIPREVMALQTYLRQYNDMKSAGILTGGGNVEKAFQMGLYAFLVYVQFKRKTKLALPSTQLASISQFIDIVAKFK